MSGLIITKLLAIALALVGVGVTAYIRYKKTRPQEAMVCPLGSDCKQVINSQYAEFFGIPLEIFGFLYYLLIALSYAATIVVPTLTSTISPFLFPMTVGAVLFSAYLTFIQAFTLREWCTWCLLSAAMSTGIFLLALGATDFGAITSFLVTIRPALIIAHLSGLVLGLGAATYGDILFLRFLRDLKISHDEEKRLRQASQFVWFGLGLLVISGAGIFLTDPSTYLVSEKFWVKMFVVLVIALNGAFLNLYITPRLVRISWGDSHHHVAGELKHDRGLAFTSGAISVVSWWSAMILGFLDRAPVSFWVLLSIYFLAIIGAIFFSRAFEQRVAARGHHDHSEPDEPTPAPPPSA